MPSSQRSRELGFQTIMTCTMRKATQHFEIGFSWPRTDDCPELAEHVVAASHLHQCEMPKRGLPNFLLSSRSSEQIAPTHNSMALGCQELAPAGYLGNPPPPDFSP